MIKLAQTAIVALTLLATSFLLGSNQVNADDGKWNESIFLPRNWQPQQVQAMKIKDCNLFGHKNSLPTGEIYGPFGATEILTPFGEHKMEFNSETGVYSGKVAQYNVTAKRVMSDKDLPKATKGMTRREYQKALWNVDFMEVVITDENGETPEMGDADFTKRNSDKVYLDIGKYHNDGFATSNSSDLNLITIPHFDEWKYTSITVHCDLYFKLK